MCEQANKLTCEYFCLSVCVWVLMHYFCQLPPPPSDAVKRGFLSIALQLSPLFWVAFALRIKCLSAFLEGQLCRQFFASKGEGENEDEDHLEDYDTDYDEQCGLALICSTTKRLVSLHCFKMFFQSLSDFALFFCLLFQNPFLLVPLLAIYPGSFSAWSCSLCANCRRFRLHFDTSPAIFSCTECFEQQRPELALPPRPSPVAAPSPADLLGGTALRLCPRPPRRGHLISLTH